MPGYPNNFYIIGHMHLAIFLGEYPITTQASFSFSFLKVGIPLVKISAVLAVFETLTFSIGDSHF